MTAELVIVPAEVAELVTPTGILLPDTDVPRSPEWFAARRGGITGTDVPKILGLSKYGNARSVWHDKLGELTGDDEETEAGRWGRIFEEPIAQEWARLHGTSVVPIGAIRHCDEAWMRVSPDRLVTRCPDGYGELVCGVEIKTRSAYVAGKWREDIPDDVLAQVAWQRRVTGWHHVHTAALVGQKLSEHLYLEDPELEAYIVTAARGVWDAIQTRTPPPVDMDGVLLRLLEQLYPSRDGIQEIDEEAGAQLLAEYHAAQRAERVAETRKEAAKAAVVLALGDAEVLACGDRNLFTYREQTRTAISASALEDNDVELYLQVLEGGHITETTSRVLRAAKRGAEDE